MHIKDLYKRFYTLLENPKLYTSLITIVRHRITFEMFRLQMSVFTVCIRTYIGMIALNVTIFMQRK